MSWFLVFQLVFLGINIGLLVANAGMGNTRLALANLALIGLFAVLAFYTGSEQMA